MTTVKDPNVIPFDTTKNRHPVDELVEVREQIKDLEAKADTLRKQIIEAKDWEGDEHTAHFHERPRIYIKQDELIQHYGKVTLAPFLIETTQGVLRTRKRRPRR